VLAFFAWRRHSWAWALLLVSIGVAVVFELVSLPWSLVHLAAGVVALRLLLLRPIRAWFRGARPPVSPPTGWAPPDPGTRHGGDQPSQQRPHDEPPVW
jgi:hypothetical protein